MTSVSWPSSYVFCVVAIPISFSQPVMNSAVGWRGRALGAHGVAELQRLAAAGHLAHAVAVGVLVAGLVEDRVGLVEVEVELLVVGDLRHPRRGSADGLIVVGRRRRARSRRGRRSSACRSRGRSPCGPSGRAAPGAAFLRPSPPLIANSLKPPWLPSTRHDRRPRPRAGRTRRRARRGRSRSRRCLQRRDHRVGVVEVADHDLVERRLAAPVVRVRLEAGELALLELVERERAGADAVLAVVLRDRLLVVLARRCASGRCRRPSSAASGPAPWT